MIRAPVSQVLISVSNMLELNAGSMYREQAWRTVWRLLQNICFAVTKAINITNKQLKLENTCSYKTLTF